MKYLIKQYYYFLGGTIRRKEVFPNSLYCFYRSLNLDQFGLFKEFPYSSKKPTEITFLLAFLFTTTLKYIIK